MVICEHDQRIVLDPLLLKRRKDPADIIIDQADHAIVSRFHLAPLMIAQPAIVIFFIAASFAYPVAAEMRRFVLQLPVSSDRC